MSISVSKTIPVNPSLLEEGVTLAAHSPNKISDRLSDSLSAGDLRAAFPHKVFRAPFASLQSATLLKKVVLSGWRYMLLDKEGVFAAAEIDVSANNEPLRFGRVTQGFLVDSTVDALREVENKIKAKKRGTTSYEAALIEILEIPFVALWLQSNNKDQDLIFPLMIGFERKQEFKGYTDVEITKELRKRFKLSFKKNEKISRSQVPKITLRPKKKS